MNKGPRCCPELIILPVNHCTTIIAAAAFWVNGSHWDKVIGHLSRWRLISIVMVTSHQNKPIMTMSSECDWLSLLSEPPLSKQIFAPLLIYRNGFWNISFFSGQIILNGYGQPANAFSRLMETGMSILLLENHHLTKHFMVLYWIYSGSINRNKNISLVNANALELLQSCAQPSISWKAQLYTLINMLIPANLRQIIRTEAHAGASFTNRNYPSVDYIDKKSHLHKLRAPNSIYLLCRWRQGMDEW